MTASARRRAWAPPLRRRLPVAALTAMLGLLVPGVAGGPSPAAGPPASSGGSGPVGMSRPAFPTSAATAGVATAGVAAAGVATAGAVAAGAEDGTGLRVVLDAVDPVVLQPGQPARLTGRVINPAPSPARLGGVTVSASTSLLGSRKEVADWVDGGVDRATSWVLGDDTVGPLVPAEGEVDFAVTVPADALGSLPDGPAALAVRISAGVDGDGAPVGSGEGDLAELRTVLTSAGDQPLETPLEVSWVVPLTLPADPGLVDPDPARHAQAWNQAVGEGSSVSGWLDHLTLPDVTWVVDPALLVAPRPYPSVASPVPGPEETEETEEPSDPALTEGPAEPTPTEPASPADPQDEEDRTQTPTGSAPGVPPAPGPTLAATPTPDGTSDSPAPDQPGTTGQAPAPDDAVGTTGPAAPPEDDPPEGEGPPEDDAPDEEDVEQALTRLRDRLADLPEESRWWLPAGDPDLARLIADGLTPPPETVEDLLTRGLPPEAPRSVTRLLRSGRSHVLWPALAGPTTPDLHRMLGLYSSAPSAPTPEVVVVPRDSFTASSAAGPRRGAVPEDETGLVAVGADSWTTALVSAAPSAAQEDGAGATTQRVLAHTLGSWLEAPTTQRELVIAPPRGTAPATEVLEQLVEAWPDADWLATVPAEELVSRASGQETVALSGTPPQEVVLGGLAPLLLPGESPVDAGRGRDLVNLSDDLDGLAQVLREGDALRSWRPVLAGLWSTRWRQDTQAWPVTFRALGRDVREAREAVHIAPSNVNFIADQGVIQVTVVNDLPVAVDDVQLAVTATNGRLQVLRQPDPISVGPGSRAAVPFEARAVTRGEVTLHVELTAPDGTDLGVDEEIAVRVQPTGVWIYWVLGGLATVVLVLGLARALPGPPRVPPDGGPSGTAYPDPGPDGPTDTGQEERQ